MRLVAAVCVRLVIAAVPSRAQPYTGPDGFGIWPYVNSNIGKCRPLTDQSKQSFGLSAEETAIVAIFAKNVGRSIAFSSTCWLIKRGSKWLLWDTGVPESALKNPKGWSTLPKLIVYHLDKTLTDQLAEIGLKTSDITYVALSHTHGEHIGNVLLFPNSTVLMQRAELYVDQFSQWDERQRESIEGSRT